MIARSSISAPLWIVAALLLAGWGCTSDAPEPPAGATAALPAHFFLAEKPEAKSLLEVKNAAALGDEVAFEARIGGRLDPFVPGRAVVLVVDPILKTCDQLEGDACPTPWDYCCESPANLTGHSATVQFVDAGGKPFPFSVKDLQGLSALKTIRVVGTVSQKGDSVLVVNARGVWIGG